MSKFFQSVSEAEPVKPHFKKAININTTSDDLDQTVEGRTGNSYKVLR
jgi:hypothetical protein